MRLRILTWNIHKAVGGLDRRYDLSRVASYLEGQEAHIALLQEVGEGWPGAGRASQAPELARMVGYQHFAFAHEHRYQVGGYGNAIFSCFPLHDIEHIDLTIDWRKQRGALQARVLVRIDEHQRTVVVNNLHLGLAGTERSRQLERFLSCSALSHLHHDTPVVVAGDLNDVYGSLGPRHLAPRGFTRAGALTSTFPAAVPLRPLDGVFYRGALTLDRAARGHGRLASTASDHRPLIADFDLPVG